MALLKIKDFDPNYRETFGGYDIKGLTLYSDVNNEKIGTIDDLMVDERGHFRYFIVDLGFWGFGKKVMLPVGRTQIDDDGRHVHALGFTKSQAENLPEFNESLKIDNDYEKRVRGAYQQPAAPDQAVVPPAPATYPGSQTPMMGQPIAPNPAAYPPSPQMGYQPADVPPHPMPGQPPVQQPIQQNHPNAYPTADPQAQYDYQQDPALYGMNDKNHSILRRYEERLIASKQHGLPK
jgi:stress response protein YsnF